MLTFKSQGPQSTFASGGRARFWNESRKCEGMRGGGGGEVY